MKRISWFTVGFVFLVGLSFRMVFPGHYGVGFDQVQILTQANRINTGDLTLIGPRTGPAQMFTGPLIYYLAAVGVSFVGEMATVALLPGIIAALTGLAIYGLGCYYLGQREGLTALVIWAFSPFLVTADRTLWNPNLILLASFLIFLPIQSQKNNQLSAVCLLIGGYLSYQAHFSGLGLGLLAFIWLIKQKAFKNLIALVVGIGFSLLPTVVFDFRNQFLNLHGLIGLGMDKSQLNIIQLAKDITHNWFIVAETMGKLFLAGNSTELVVFTGLILWFGSLYWAIRQKRWGWPVLVTGLLPALYGFYQGSKPEYYFLVMVPALIFLFLNFSQTYKPKLWKWCLVAFSLISTLTNLKLAKINSGMTVANIREIRASLQKEPIKSIVYDIDYGSEVGVKYFLDQIPTTETGGIYHVSYPHNLQFNGINRVADVAWWRDDRRDSFNYIAKAGYFLETKADIFLYEDLYPRREIQDYQAYKLVKDNQILGELGVAYEGRDKIWWVRDCLKQKELKNFTWIPMEQGFIRYTAAYCLYWQPNDGIHFNYQEIELR